MKEIDHRRKNLEQSPTMPPPSYKNLEFNVMEDYGHQVLLGTAHQIPKL